MKTEHRIKRGLLRGSRIIGKTGMLLLGLVLGGQVAVGATFTVTSTNDAGAGSLREAIELANGTPGADTIVFNIEGPGPHVIYPLTQLPVVTEALAIDGFSQPGAVDAPVPTILIEINGAWVDIPPETAVLGLVLETDNSLVQGIAVNNFPNSGIVFRGSNIVIRRNIAGLDATGTLRNPVGRWGIYGIGCDTVVVTENTASGNGIGGILVRESMDVTLSGNRVGTDPTGQNALGNGVFIPFYGMVSFLNEGVQIAKNVISGNLGNGVLIEGTQTFSLTSNKIGVAADNGTPLGNPAWGGYILTSAAGEVKDNHVGYNGALGMGLYLTEELLIEDNHFEANGNGDVLVEESTALVIADNVLGVDATGMQANSSAMALRLFRSSSIEVTGNHAAGAEWGIMVQWSDEVSVKNNRIGINKDGTATLGSAFAGVASGFRTSNILISENHIGGARLGVYLNGSGENVEVVANTIGVSEDGKTALPVENGILIEYSNQPATIHSNTVAFATANAFRGYYAHGTVLTDNTFCSNGDLPPDADPEEVFFAATVFLAYTDGCMVSGNSIRDGVGNGIFVQSGFGNLIQNNRVSGHLHGVVIAKDYYEFYENGEFAFGNERSTESNAILGNSLFDNRDLGIELILKRTIGNFPDPPVTETIGAGPQANDELDLDEGPNGFMNRPVLQVAILKDGVLTAKGNLKGLVDSMQLVQVFSSAAPDESGFGEGKRFLGEMWVTTNEEGNVHFNLPTEHSLEEGQWITTTATDADGNTSEFSNAVQVKTAGWR